MTHLLYLLRRWVNFVTKEIKKILTPGLQFPVLESWAQCYKTFYHSNLPPFHGHTIILCYKQHYLGNYCRMAVNYHWNIYGIEFTLE